MPTLLTLCGSLRAASLNRTLLAAAASRWPEARVIEGDLRLPLYDGDIEAQGIPPEVVALARAIADADAVLIATPEYNKGLSGVLKNALDWVSRVEGAPWAGKPVAIVSATAGRAGGERAQQMLRWCLNPFRPNVIAGPEVLIGGAANAFDEHGALKDDRSTALLDELMASLRAAAGH